VTGVFMNRRLIQCRRQPGRAGFTLLEILVASMIVAMLMLIIGRIFVDANRVYELGTKDMDINAEARAVLEFMAQELASAPAEDGPLALYLDDDAKSPNDSDDLYFATIDSKPVNTNDLKREVALICYTVTSDGDGYKLSRGLKINNIECYDYNKWWETESYNYNTLLRGVYLLQFHYMVYSGGSFEEALGGNSDINSIDYNVEPTYPDFIDITLGVMSENDMRRWALLSGADQTEYEERFGKVFRARVFLHNAYGYDMMTR
jgi:prepilin-type N-terminal cleavage/methylation domain-containing protein